jgi:hypothetical protein
MSFILLGKLHQNPVPDLVHDLKMLNFLGSGTVFHTLGSHFPILS